MRSWVKIQIQAKQRGRAKNVLALQSGGRRLAAGPKLRFAQPLRAMGTALAWWWYHSAFG